MAKAKKSPTKKSPTKLNFEAKEIDPPAGDSERHLFKVTLVVLADSHGTPDEVLQHVMGGCLRHPYSLPVVNGYGAEVMNLTLSGKTRNGPEKFDHGGRMHPVGFKNRPVPKKKISILQVAE